MRIYEGEDMSELDDLIKAQKKDDTRYQNKERRNVDIDKIDSMGMTPVATVYGETIPGVYTRAHARLDGRTIEKCRRIREATGLEG